MSESGSAATFLELLEEAEVVYMEQGYILDQEKRERMLKLCELSDRLAAEFDIEDYDIAIYKTDCFLSFEVNSMEFHNGKSHPFFELIQNADNMTFEKAESGDMRVRFIVKELMVIE